MNLLPFSWARIVSDKKYMRFFQILAWKIVESIFLFTITEGRLVHTSHPRKGVSMEIKFKRKITSEMMTTFNPSLDDHLCHHILQALLLRGSLEREPDHHAGGGGGGGVHCTAGEGGGADIGGALRVGGGAV